MESTSKLKLIESNDLLRFSIIVRIKDESHHRFHFLLKILKKLDKVTKFVWNYQVQSLKVLQKSQYFIPL